MSAVKLADEAFRARLRLEVHDRMCRSSCPHREPCSHRWVQWVHGWADTLNHLHDRPRDAAGARQVMHDLNCASQFCDGGEHLKRFAPYVVAMRATLAALS